MTGLTREEALARLHQITRGIDDDGDNDPGWEWWETSTGAERGREVLVQLEALITEVTQ